VVGAERVGGGDGLGLGRGGAARVARAGGGGEGLEGGGAGRGQQAGGRRGEGEDIGRVGGVDGVGGEVLLGLAGSALGIEGRERHHFEFALLIWRFDFRLFLVEDEA
jgi:hypothetical protein